MIVSVNWLKKFTSIDLPIHELATLIGARLVEIEEVVDLGAKYKDVIVARVVSCEPVPDSDHLNLCKIDDGGVRQGVERDESGYVQVVCGAPNVRAGLMVAWLPPQAVVPETYGTAEPFELGARKLRGFMSNGMLASAKELDLFEDHTGILELDTTCVAGARFADVYELNDYLLDIENKSLTHRPDTFGIIGFAREVAAIQGNAFTTPDWLAALAPIYGEKQGDVPMPIVTIDNPALSARFQAVVLAGVDGAAQSPLLVQTYLARIGMRPINALVDATNYLMMLTGQPLGIYDYDKIVALDSAAHIHVRNGRDGETLELLDGRTIELATGDVVVAAGETAIGLAGAMGGANTVVDEHTKNIMIEAATFDLYSLRATQMRHGIFSEAITRFTKGQPAPLTAPVLADTIRLVREWTGGVRVSEVADTLTEPVAPTLIRLPVAQINATLGTDLSLDETVQHLVDTEFTVGLDDMMLDVTVPYWRADMHIPEDVIEEVGRLGGFDSIAATMPHRTFRAVMPTRFDDMRRRVRAALVRAGANEVLTYSFVHGDMLRKVGLAADESYRITNSISPDLQYYRQTLTPSLLNLVHGNSKNGYDGFSLFELNKVHSKVLGMTDAVPTEAHHLALVVAGKKPVAGALYYQAKALLDYAAEQLGLEFTYQPLIHTDTAIARPFEPKRSAEVRDAKSGEVLGIIGEYRSAVAKSFKLAYAAGFELDTEALMRAVEKVETSYVPLSRYPGTERDICYQVSPDVSYAAVASAARHALKETELVTSIAPVDIYQPEDGAYKNITLRFSFVSHSHTLTGDEVAETVKVISDSVVATTGASVI